MNTGTPDGNKLVDQILSAILPQYKKNMEDGAASHPAAPALPPVGPSQAIIGSWSGFIQTYRGRTPLTLSKRYMSTARKSRKSRNQICRNSAGMRLSSIPFKQRRVTSLAATIRLCAVKTHYALYAALGSALTR